MTKEELRRKALTISPPMIKPKEPSKREKLHFWWADVKLFFRKGKGIAIIVLTAYIATIVIFVLSYITVHYLHLALRF